MSNEPDKKGMDRRGFLAGLLAAGAAPSVARAGRAVSQLTPVSPQPDAIDFGQTLDEYENALNRLLLDDKELFTAYMAAHHPRDQQLLAYLGNTVEKLGGLSDSDREKAMERFRYTGELCEEINRRGAIQENGKKLVGETIDRLDGLRERLQGASPEAMEEVLVQRLAGKLWERVTTLGTLATYYGNNPEFIERVATEAEQLSPPDISEIAFIKKMAKMIKKEGPILEIPRIKSALKQYYRNGGSFYNVDMDRDTSRLALNITQYRERGEVSQEAHEMFGRQLLWPRHVRNTLQAALEADKADDFMTANHTMTQLTSGRQRATSVDLRDLSTARLITEYQTISAFLGNEAKQGSDAFRRGLNSVTARYELELMRGRGIELRNITTDRGR